MSVIALDPRLLTPRLGIPAVIQSARRSTITGRLVAAYVFLMPLIAGIPRGSVVPFLRLTELLQAGLTGLAVIAAVIAYTRGSRWRFVIQPVDWCMVAVAVCGSVVPIASLVARGESVEFDVMITVFPMAKYLMLWLLVRLAVRTMADVTVVLLSAVSVGMIVASLAMLEGLGIGPTGRFTRSLISDEAVTGPVEGRANTLLGSGLSTGAVLAICATVAFGLAVTHRSPASMLATGIVLFGALATGQATSGLALVFIITLVAVHHRVVGRTLAAGIPLLLVGLVSMAPIIQGRLAEAGSRSVVPQSWIIRWVNVTELYWPPIADGGWLLGVTPDTVVIPPDTWRDEVFLESGYLWMLWVGGLPLLVAYLSLLFVCWRTLKFETQDPTYEVARVTARGVIGFMAVFNIIDPHLSLRGGADLMFVLVPLAFAFTPLARPATRRSDALNLVEARDHRPISAHARIQIGEIGGPLLRSSGWPTVSPAQGHDRGIDIAVRDRGVTIGEARVYFEAEGNHLVGLMLHPVRSVDDAAEALVWRGILLCAKSMRLRSLMTPPGTNGLVELDRHEIAEIAARAERLEMQRDENVELTNVLNRNAPWSEQEVATPVGIRLEPNSGVSGVRRAIDIVVAGGALVFFTPFALAIALAIRRSSPGPIFFRQMRIGAGGRPFRLLKFRTMDNSAGPDLHRESIERSVETGVPSTKIDDDPRITRAGAFLRTWSLDEVPQLLNVLRGEMTLVGPRPSLIWETSTFSPGMRRRLQLRPGIAGLWQASGRGDLSNEEMLELDLDYAESASVGNDAKLLAQTAVAVVTRKGAR